MAANLRFACEGSARQPDASPMCFRFILALESIIARGGSDRRTVPSHRFAAVSIALRTTPNRQQHGAAGLPVEDAARVRYLYVPRTMPPIWDVQVSMGIPS